MADIYEVKITSQAREQMAEMNFLVYYWIDKAEKRIQVIAVIYSKRDQLEQLKNMKLDD